MTGIATVYAVFADRGEADRIGHVAVEERLAACVNILGQTESIYWWNDKVETASECAALFKTAADRTEALVARIVELHSYDNPAVAVWPVSHTPPAYAQWVEEHSR